MSLNRSRLLIAATAVAAMGVLGTAPALAAGMASSHGSMMSTHDHMTGDDMSTQHMTQHHTAKMRHEKPMQTTKSGGMKTQGGMK